MCSTDSGAYGGASPDAVPKQAEKSASDLGRDQLLIPRRRLHAVLTTIKSLRARCAYYGGVAQDRVSSPAPTISPNMPKGGRAHGVSAQDSSRVGFPAADGCTDQRLAAHARDANVQEWIKTYQRVQDAAQRLAITAYDGALGGARRSSSRVPRAARGQPVRRLCDAVQDHKLKTCRARSRSTSTGPAVQGW